MSEDPYALADDADVTALEYPDDVHPEGMGEVAHTTDGPNPGDEDEADLEVTR